MFRLFGNWYHFCIESCAKRLLSRLLNDLKQSNDSLIETQLLLDEAKSIHLWNFIIAIIFIGNVSNAKFAMANVSSFILTEMTEYGKMCIIIKIIMENFRRVLFLYDCTNCTLYWSYACPNLVNNSLMLSRIWNRWTWLLVHETLRMKMELNFNLSLARSENVFVWWKFKRALHMCLKRFKYWNCEWHKMRGQFHLWTRVNKYWKSGFS